MADLAAEMARFEAELAGVGEGPGALPPPPLQNGAAMMQPPFAQVRPSQTSASCSPVLTAFK